jgi:hypothetical protein
VLECGDIQLASQINRLVGTAVINQEHLVNDIEGKLLICLAQRPSGVVRWHHYNNFFPVKHVIVSSDLFSPPSSEVEDSPV